MFSLAKLRTTTQWSTSSLCDTETCGPRVDASNLMAIYDNMPRCRVIQCIDSYQKTLLERSLIGPTKMIIKLLVTMEITRI